MGYYDENRFTDRLGMIAVGIVLAGLFFLARWIYQLPWATLVAQPYALVDYPVGCTTWRV